PAYPLRRLAGRRMRAAAEHRTPGARTDQAAAAHSRAARAESADALAGGAAGNRRRGLPAADTVAAPVGLADRSWSIAPPVRVRSLCEVSYRGEHPAHDTGRSRAQHPSQRRRLGSRDHALPTLPRTASYARP